MEPNSNVPKPTSPRRWSIWLVAGLVGGLVLVCLAGGLVIMLGVISLPRLTGIWAPDEADVAVIQATLPPTSTPTPVPTPTVTPTPPGSTPVAVAPAEGWTFEGVRVQPHPDQGWLLVYGEAINESGQSQSILGLQGTFYDAQGQPLTIDEYEDYWPIETLPDGHRMPFELTLYGPAAVEQVELQIITEPGSESLRTGLEISDLEGRESNEEFCVWGQIRGPEPPLAEYAMVAVVLYDDDDRVINWGIGYQPAEAFDGQDSVQIGACAERYNHLVARYELRAWGE
jgi:hypothetical protein